MWNRVFISICVIFLLINLNQGLEYSKQQQRYNPNADFLLHEVGAYQNGGKKDPLGSPISSTLSSISVQQGANNGNRENVAQSPASGPSSTTKSSVVSNQNSGKRDYVAPSPKTSASRAPQSPTTAATTTTTRSTGGKRDYVAPQFPTLKPVSASNQPSPGKVKDLINFYDNRNQNQPQRVPSYSSILQGSTNQNVPGSVISLSTPTTQASVSTRPLSYSNVVSGSKLPSVPATGTTVKPATGALNVPATRPNGPLLPSSILNNRNNNNQNTNSNSATDLELQTLSEELLRKDVNNAAKYVTVNYQEKTTSHSKEDKAPGPLLSVSSEAWSIPTIQAFLPLLDNYERDTQVNEYVTPQERNEENAFMDAIMTTTVIRHLMNFLKDKGYVTPDPRQQRDFLKQMWFGLYSRGRGRIGSSGFEHVFVSELKNGEVSGLHNWIYFSKEEAANRINYLGYLKYVQFNDKGALLKLHFNQQGTDKPVDSLFIGTSPELELSLYTLCFVTRPNGECKLKLANNDIDIITYAFRYRSKDFIGTAYAQFPSNWN